MSALDWHSGESPEFIKGIGPPLTQIEEDYRELAKHGWLDGRVSKDVLALIAEVRRLRVIEELFLNGE